MYRHYLILLVFGVIFAGCKSPQQTMEAEQITGIEKLEGIDISDGIDRAEAQLIAEWYFHNFISGCGACEKSEDKGKQWETRCLFGFAAEPMENPIITDKQTGRTYMEGYQIVDNPLDIK